MMKATMQVALMLSSPYSMALVQVLSILLILVAVALTSVVELLLTPAIMHTSRARLPAVVIPPPRKHMTKVTMAIMMSL